MVMELKEHSFMTFRALVKEAQMSRHRLDSYGLSVEDDNIILEAAGRKFLVDEWGAQRLCSVNGWGRGMLHRFKGNPELFTAVTDYLQQKVDNKDPLYGHSFGSVLGNFVRGDSGSVLFNGYLDVIGEIVRPEKVVVNRFDPTYQDVDFLSEIKHEVMPGDVSQVGVSVSCYTDVMIRPVVFRLVCSNGLTRRIELDAETVTGNIGVAVEKAYHYASDRLLPMFQKATERVIENPESYLARLRRERHLVSSEMNKIIDRLPELERPVTLYTLVNFITDFAKAKKYLRFRNLLDNMGRLLEQEVGGSLPRCPQCLSVLEVK